MTIKDIAKKTGYSVSTVSRVLNNHPDVSPEAKARITEVVNSMGFVPNANAQNLKKIDTQNIVILVKGIANMLFVPMMELIQSAISEEGYKGIVEFIDEDSNEITRALQLIIECRPKGIVFLGGSIAHFQEDFSKIAVPCVLLTNDASELGFDNLSSVCIDDVRGAASAVKYLIDLGHRKIGIIGGDIKLSSTSALRHEGCLKAFTEADVPFDEEKSYMVCRYSYASAYKQTKKLLARCPETTAIFAFSDVMAIGTIRGVLDCGLRVPEDISVVGYDRIDLSRYSNPKLSTIEQNWKQIASRGTEILIERIQKETAAVHETIPFSLVKEESASAPKS